jgi:hypothetical protein
MDRTIASGRLAVTMPASCVVVLHVADDLRLRPAAKQLVAVGSLPSSTQAPLGLGYAEPRSPSWSDG